MGGKSFTKFFQLFHNFYIYQLKKALKLLLNLTRPLFCQFPHLVLPSRMEIFVSYYLFFQGSVLTIVMKVIQICASKYSKFCKFSIPGVFLSFVNHGVSGSPNPKASHTIRLVTHKTRHTLLNLESEDTFRDQIALHLGHPVRLY